MQSNVERSGELRRDVITEGPIARLASTLDHPTFPTPEVPLRPLWHWLFFLPQEPQSGLGEDGHPRRGTFLPDIKLRRRMFAAGSVRFLQPLWVGDRVQRKSQITSVEQKTGRSGPLAFVTVSHEVSSPRGLAITESQTFVYTDAKPQGHLQPETRCNMQETWEATIALDPTLLFRFSALTFNAHRIHYDVPYATEVEGYPDLVVQAPLIAVLLSDLATRVSHQVGSLEFKALSPFHVGEIAHLSQKDGSSGVELSAKAHNGDVRMEAIATFVADRD